MPRLGLGRSLAVTRRTGSILTGAHTFNGTTTRVALTTAIALQNITVMCWVKSNFAASGRIFDARDTDNDGVSMSNTTVTNIRSSYNAVTGNYGSFVNATWTHVAITANTTGELLSIIINGVSVATSDITGTNISVTTIPKIGCRNFGTATEFYKGQLAQMAVFNTALTEAQIVAIMNKSYSGLTAGEKTGLVSWWALTSISGTSVPDLHGANHGTLTP